MLAYRGIQIASRWKRWSRRSSELAGKLTGHRLRPIRIALAHPRCAASAEFETFLGLPIDFGAEGDEIAFSAAARNLPVVSADPYLNKCLVSYWETALARRSSRQDSIRAAVENAILPLLPHGKARIGKVAEDLGVSARTLSRRLAAEGVTFAQVFDEMRADLVEGYLSDRSLSITHIAWLLGFQEASAFTHAYKRWTGKPPTDRRKAERTSGDDPTGSAVPGAAIGRRSPFPQREN